MTCVPGLKIYAGPLSEFTVEKRKTKAVCRKIIKEAAARGWGGDESL